MLWAYYLVPKMTEQPYILAPLLLCAGPAALGQIPNQIEDVERWKITLKTLNLHNYSAYTSSSYHKGGKRHHWVCAAYEVVLSSSTETLWLSSWLFVLLAFAESRALYSHSDICRGIKCLLKSQCSSKGMVEKIRK